MKTLALETSAKSVSVAVTEDGRVLASSYQNIGLTHSVTLMPLLDGMLQNAGLALSDMDLLAVAAHQAQHTNCMCMVLASWSGGKSFFLSKRSRTRGGRMRKVEAARIPVTDVHLKSVSADSVGRKSMPRRALIRAITNGRRGRGMNISKNTSHSRRYHVSATSFACLRAPGQVPRAGLLQQASGIVS